METRWKLKALPNCAGFVCHFSQATDGTLAHTADSTPALGERLSTPLILSTPSRPLTIPTNRGIRFANCDSPSVRETMALIWLEQHSILYSRICSRRRPNWESNHIESIHAVGRSRKWLPQTSSRISLVSRLVDRTGHIPSPSRRPRVHGIYPRRKQLRPLDPIWHFAKFYLASRV